MSTIEAAAHPTTAFFIPGGRVEYHADDIISYGNAEVYRARFFPDEPSLDSSSSPYVAVKVQKHPVGYVFTGEEELAIEAATLERLQHEAIPTIHGYVCDPWNHEDRMVLDYAPHGSVREAFNQRLITPEMAILIAISVADVLHYTHTQETIHRDVKPENLLFAKNGTIMLTDFGVAVNSKSTTPRKETLAGTWAYIPPEQWRRESVSASDQYALAATLYELLTGTRPFRGETLVELIRQHSDVPPKPFPKYLPPLALAVESIVMTGLSKNSEHRFPSTAEFGQALHAVYQEFVDKEVQVERFLCDGRKLLAEGSYVFALFIFNAAIAVNPASFEALEAKIEALKALGAYDEAREIAYNAQTRVEDKDVIIEAIPTIRM